MGRGDGRGIDKGNFRERGGVERKRGVKNNPTIFDFPLDFSSNVYYNIYVGNKIPNKQKQEKRRC